MTGNGQVAGDNSYGVKTNSLGESITLLGKCPIDKGQPQYYAHVRCDLEMEWTLGFSQFGPGNYDITRACSMYFTHWVSMHWLCML